MKTKCIYLLLIVIYVGLCNLLNAQTKDSLVLDPSIRHGRFSNGLEYFIKPLKDSSEKLHMNLIVNAGFNQERADQLDIGHAIEHLAFRASKNFPLGLIAGKTTESLGIPKEDVTAGMAYPYTQYDFNVPAENTQALNTGLLWFRDIIDGLALTTVDIDIERKVLRQEFLLRNETDLNGYFARLKMNGKLYPCVNSVDDFFEQNKTFSQSMVKEFYKDWYRPDLSAIVIVGPVKNMNELEKKMKATFSTIPMQIDSKKKRDCDTFYYGQPQRFFTIKRDLDASKSIENDRVKLHLFFRDSIINNSAHTFKGLKKAFSHKLLTDLLRTRFEEAYKLYNPAYELFVKDEQHPAVMHGIITAQNGSEKEAVKQSIKILRQVKEYGITEKEWKTTKTKFLGYLRPEQTSTVKYWVSAILENYCYDEALPANKLSIIRSWLANLGHKEFNLFLKNNIKEMPEDIAIIAPRNSSSLALKEKEVRLWIKQTWKEKTKPYVPSKAPENLMSKKDLAHLYIKPYKDMGTVETGAREIELRNGVKVILVQDTLSSNSSKGTIRLHGFAPYGSSSSSEDDYFSAINAPSIIKNTGVGAFDKFQLERFLSHTSLDSGVQPYIDYQETGVKGAASLKDFDFLLQLVYLYFTKPNQKKAAFEDWKKNKLKEYINPPYDFITIDMRNKIKEVIGDSNYTNAATLQHKGISKINLSRSFQLYKKLFGNAKDFTFLIGGNFDEDSIIPLLQKYLGNLPNKKIELCNPLVDQSDIASLKKPYVENFNSGYEMENVSYERWFLTPFSEKFNWKKNIRIQLMGKIVGFKLMNLRYSGGYGIYAPKANGYFERNLSRYATVVGIDCEAKELNDLQKEIEKITQDIKAGDISKVDFEKALQHVRSIHSSKRYWVEKRIYQHYRYNDPWVSQQKIDAYIESLSFSDIVNTAKIYYENKNQYEFTMSSQVE